MLLAALTVFAMSSAVAAAGEGQSKIIDISELKAGDAVYYGKYTPYAADGGTGVLRWTMKETGLFLSDTNVDYHEWGTTNASYQGSDVQNWMNSGTGMLKDFSAKERASARFELPTLAQIRSWFPCSAYEEETGAASRYCKNSPYWAAKAESGEPVEDNSGNGHTVPYWLQDTVPDGEGVFDNAAYVIDDEGTFNSFMTCFPVDESHAVRPVLSLSAKGYASTNDVKEKGSGMTVTSGAINREFKLSLIVPEAESDFGTIQFGKSTVWTEKTSSGVTSHLSISCTPSAGNQGRAAVYIKKDGKVVYYGAAQVSAGKPCEFAVPMDLTGCQILAYREQYNGSNATDLLTSETELKPEAVAKPGSTKYNSVPTGDDSEAALWAGAAMIAVLLLVMAGRKNVRG